MSFQSNVIGKGQDILSYTCWLLVASDGDSTVPEWSSQLVKSVTVVHKAFFWRSEILTHEPTVTCKSALVVISCSNLFVVSLCSISCSNCKSLVIPKLLTVISLLERGQWNNCPGHESSLNCAARTTVTASKSSKVGRVNQLLASATPTGWEPKITAITYGIT